MRRVGRQRGFAPACLRGRNARLRWLADENFNHAIVRGLRRRNPDLDLIRAQDAGLTGLRDEALLEWAAANDRIVLTHDVATITAFAYRRIARGERMPGVLEIGGAAPVRDVINDILLLNDCSEPKEWEGQVRYLPLR
jgi:hypothetical protein